MKNLFFIAFVFLSFICTTAFSQQKIRVLTYNIHHANPPGQDSHIDLAGIATVIKNSEADLIALQELDSATKRSDHVYQLKDLANRLGMHYYFATAIPFEGGSYGIGILSKYRLSEEQTVKLPKKENAQQSEDRVFALVKVHLPQNKYIWFGCTHLDVKNEENRVMQSEKIIETAKDKTPIIIGGDFNAEPDSPTIQSISTFFKPTSQKLEPTLPNRNPYKRIDFIFYASEKHFHVLDEKVMTEADTESDHLPFWTDIEIKQAPTY